MPFEHPPNYNRSEVIEECGATALAALLSLWLYGSIGSFVRTLMQWTYLTAGSLYDTWLTRVTQDVLLGILTLMVFGAIASVLYILVVSVSDASFSPKLSTS